MFTRYINPQATQIETTLNKSLFNAMLAVAVVIFVGAWIYSGKVQPRYKTDAEAEPQAILDRIRPVSETVNDAGSRQGTPGEAAVPDVPVSTQSAATVSATVGETADTVVATTPVAVVSEPAVADQADAGSSSKLGEETYAAACIACHTTGVAGSPKLGDVETWAPRIAQGMDVLNEHAIKGFQGSTGLMPPKGGRIDLSDEAIIAAVAYMVAESGGT